MGYYIFIFVLILLLQQLGRFIRKKMAKPATEDGVQKPGKLDNFLLKFIKFLTFFGAFFTVIGLLIQEMEMTIVFLVLTVIFAGIVWLLQREYNMTYQENEEYFILNAKNKEYKVFYKDIVDWLPGFNEIQILDKTRTDDRYVPVNIAMLKPEILLQTLVEMTFDERFSKVDPMPADDDLYRKHELVNFLVSNNYEYLIEDYVEKLN